MKINNNWSELIDLFAMHFYHNLTKFYQTLKYKLTNLLTATATVMTMTATTGGEVMVTVATVMVN